MDRGKLLIAGITILAVGIGIGRYATPSSKTVTVDSQIKTDSQTNIVDKSKVSIVTVKRPDGTTTITELINKDVDTSKTKTVDETTKTVDTTINDRPKWTVSALAAYDLKNLTTLTPTFGASVSKEFLGLNVGAFGLLNGTVGASLGISF